jgi:hypothetical protein
MPSKYAKVIDSLEPLPVEDPSAQEKIDKLKTELTAGVTHTPESLARAYALARLGEDDRPVLHDVQTKMDHLALVQHDDEVLLLRQAIIDLFGKEGLTALLAEAQKRVTAYEQLLADSHDKDETGWGQYGASDNTVKLQSGQSVSVQHEPTAKVEDPEKFRLWCIANGYENALRLWPSTTNAITKERLVAGKPEPDGVKAYVYTKIVLRK